MGSTTGLAAMLDASTLHVTFAEGTAPDGPVTPRRYTLTHSDRTGHLFLAIGADYDRRALHALQVRLERDEVLGDWLVDEDGARLELHMMAQGGLPIFGTGAMRYADAPFSAAHPELDDASVVACFHWRRGRVEREAWGRWGEYC